MQNTVSWKKYVSFRSKFTMLHYTCTIHSSLVREETYMILPITHAVLCVHVAWCHQYLLCGTGQEALLKPVLVLSHKLAGTVVTLQQRLDLFQNTTNTHTLTQWHCATSPREPTKKSRWKKFIITRYQTYYY